MIVGCCRCRGRGRGSEDDIEDCLLIQDGIRENREGNAR